MSFFRVEHCDDLMFIAHQGTPEGAIKFCKIERIFPSDAAYFSVNTIVPLNDASGGVAM